MSDTVPQYAKDPWGCWESEVVRIIKIQVDAVHEPPSKGILCEADLNDANLRKGSVRQINERSGCCPCGRGSVEEISTVSAGVIFVWGWA
jgi:hypothetical protein